MTQNLNLKKNIHFILKSIHSLLRLKYKIELNYIFVDHSVQIHIYSYIETPVDIL